MLVHMGILFMSSSFILCAQRKYDINKRDIQSDGGYPKFPPDEDDVRYTFQRNKLTKDIPVEARLARQAESDASSYTDGIKQFMSVMKEVYSAYQEMQQASGSEDEDELEEDSSRYGKADASSIDVSQMPEDIQKFWATAMEYYEKFQKEQAAQEQSASAEQTASANQEQTKVKDNTV